MWTCLSELLCIVGLTLLASVTSDPEPSTGPNHIITFDEFQTLYELEYVNPSANLTDTYNYVENIKDECQQDPAWKDTGRLESKNVKTLFTNQLTIKSSTNNELPPQIFYHFCRLSSFVMRDQHLKKIEEKDFENGYYLESFDFSGNEIERIEANVFKNPRIVKWIHLENNKIAFIDEEAFKLGNLRAVYLQGNKLSVLNWVPLNRWLSYRYTLKDNSTAIVESNMDIDNEFYFVMDVSNNPFVNGTESIRVKTEEINLQQNSLQWVIIHLETVKLNAKNNRISHIVFDEAGPDNEFTLEMLNLSNNSLTFTSVQELSKLTALQEVDLSHNQIESLTAQIFSKLFELRRISLNNNHLKNLNTGAFFNTLSLEYLDVSNNNLELFRLNNIFPKLTELQVNNNSLTVLDLNFKQLAPGLKKIGLNGNNWSCGHLAVALSLIPYNQIELDISNWNLKNWLNEDENNHGHVLGVPCLNKDEPAVAEQELPLRKSDVEELIDTKLDELENEMEYKFKSLDKSFSTLLN